MSESLHRAYAECAAITRREARNFYYAFLALPHARRQAIYALYAYCRIVDDAADLSPTAAEGRSRLAHLRQSLRRSLCGHPEGPIFAALADAAAHYGLQPIHLEAVLDGVEQDLTVTRYRDFHHLRDYCWKVASAVGLLSLQVFGYQDPQAPQYAEDLGLAMQLTNILRDVKEDLSRGRIYLPQDELREFGVTEASLAGGIVDEPFRRFMRFQVERARSYFQSGSRLAAMVHRRSRGCPIMLQAVYSRVLDYIEQAEYDVFSRRLGLSSVEKITLLVGTWARWLFPIPKLRHQ